MTGQTNPLSLKKRQIAQGSLEQNLTATSSPERFESQHLFGRNPSNLSVTSTPISSSKNTNGTMPQSSGGIDLDSGMGGLHSEVSLSMISVNSSFAAPRELSNGNDHHQHSQYEGYATINTPSSYYSGTNSDTIDAIILSSTTVQTLSHSAAKHKMAIRPVNRKAPSRLYRNEIFSKVNCTPITCYSCK